MGSSGVDLVDEVLSADDVVFAKSLLDLSVVYDRDTLAVNLQESTLVDEFLDGLEGGVSPSNVGLNKLEHGEGCLVQANEHSVVDLTKAQQLKDLPWFGADTKNTADSGNNSDLRLGLDKEVALNLSGSLGLNELPLLSSVLLDVLLGTDEILLLSPGGFLGNLDLLLVLLFLPCLGASQPLANNLRHSDILCKCAELLVGAPRI